VHIIIQEKPIILTTLVRREMLNANGFFSLQNELLKEEMRLESIDVKFMDGELSSEDHQRMKSNITKRRDRINTKLESQNTSVGQKLEHAFNVIRNMPDILSSGQVEHKIQLLGTMLPEKIEFHGENYRNNSFNKILDQIFQNTNELQNEKTEDQDQNSLSSVSVPRTGLFYEPFFRDLELIWRVELKIISL
jgi:site-specific DNA recombinase